MKQDSQTKPLFTDWNSYQKWLQEWKAVIHYLNSVCLNRKREIKDLNRNSQFEQLKRAREKYKYDRVMVTKMLTLHNEAAIRWKNIKAMNKAIQEQFDKFPLEIKDTKVIDFHFNKKHLEFKFVPMWILKTKGTSFYVNSVTSKVGFSTKERPDHISTKGLIRFIKANVEISASGDAVIS